MATGRDPAKLLQDYRFGTAGFNRIVSRNCSVCEKRGACPCYESADNALFDILARERAQFVRQAGTAAVHLRVGDVLDLSPYSVVQMLRRQTHFHSSCSRIEAANGCLQVAPRLYVRPLSAFSPVRSTLVALGISKVVLVAGSSRDLHNHTKSCEYVRRVGDFFRDGGSVKVAVEYRLGNHPDDDFRFLVTGTSVLVPSHGGYANLVRQVAVAFGVRIIVPEPNVSYL